MSLNALDFGYNFHATNGVSPVLGTINQGMGQLAKTTQDTSQVVQKAFFDIENAKNIASKGQAVFEGMKGMKNDFADFEAGVAEASTLLQGANTDMSMYAEQLLSYATKYGEAPADLTKTLYTAMSSGYLSAADSAAVLEQALKLSVGGVTTSAEAMDGLTTIMHSWGLSTAELERISDSLFVAMRAGKTTIGELSREIGQVSALADLSGISIEEITAATAALTLGGRNTAESMTGLRAILTEVLRGEKGTMDAAKRLGVDFSLTALRTKGLTRFMMELQEAVMKSGKEEEWAQFFGRVQGLGSAISLTGKQAGKFSEVLGQMKDKAGSTDEAVAKMMDTSKMRGKQYEASVKVMRIRIGQALSPLFTLWRNIKQVFVNMITAIAKNAPWLLQLVGALLLLGAAFAIVIAKIIAAKAFFGILMVFAKSVIASLAAGFAALGPILLPLLAVLAGVVTAIVVVKKAYENNWGGFANMVNHAVDSVRYFSSALKQLFTEGEITGATAEFLLMNETVFNVVQAVWYLATAVKFLIGGMILGFQKIGDVFEPVRGSFEAMGDTFDRIGKIWKDFMGELGLVDNAVTPMKVLAGLGMFIGYTFGFALRAVMALVGGIVAAIGSAFALLGSLIMVVWRIIRGFVRILTGDFSGGIAEMVLAVVQFAASVLTIIGGLLENIAFLFVSMFGVTRGEWNAFLTDFGAFFSAMGEYTWALISGAVGYVKLGFGFIYDAVAWTLGGIKSLFLGLGTAIVWIWDQTFGRLIGNLGFLGDAFAVLGGYLKAVWEPIVKWFEDKFGWIKDAADGVADIADTVTGAVGDIGGKISGAFSDVASSVFGGGTANTAQGGIGMSDLLAQSVAKRTGVALPVPAPAAAAGAVAPPVPSYLGRIAQAASGGGGEKAAVVQVLQPPVHTTVNIDGRVLVDVVEKQMENRGEEKLRVTVPVWSPAGGR